VTRIEASGGRVSGVVTDKGRIAADQVVVAMGSFSTAILRAVGVRVPIYPSRASPSPSRAAPGTVRRRCR